MAKIKLTETERKIRFLKREMRIYSRTGNVQKIMDLADELVRVIREEKMPEPKAEVNYKELVHAPLDLCFYNTPMSVRLWNVLKSAEMKTLHEALVMLDNNPKDLLKYRNLGMGCLRELENLKQLLCEKPLEP